MNKTRNVLYGFGSPVDQFIKKGSKNLEVDLTLNSNNWQYINTYNNLKLEFNYRSLNLGFGDGSQYGDGDGDGLGNGSNYSDGYGNSI